MDLSTRYLGLKLDSPLVVSACPLSENLDTLRRLEEAGAAAAVFPSLFEEQIEQDIERDKILTADMAKEYGIIDQVISSRKI